jgi:hypothetical protein
LHGVITHNPRVNFTFAKTSTADAYSTTDFSKERGEIVLDGMAVCPGQGDRLIREYRLSKKGKK